MAAKKSACAALPLGAAMVAWSGCGMPPKCGLIIMPGATAKP
jgi:hypothetical protein